MRPNIWISITLPLFIVAIISMPAWSGTSGKISGIITDRSSNDPLPGANVVVMGTTLGAAADANGQYTILNVPPGNYDIQIYYIGYAKTIIQNVRVQIDLTTRLNYAMQMQEIQVEEVTVVAERNIIRDDVATSVVAVTPTEIAQLPVVNVQNVVELQAGVQSGLEIRGGGADEALFMIDGITLRDPRNNQPISTIALSSIKEISVERGGFNAEYGQVRSGIVNVVTQEGSKSGYHGKMEFKYSPPAAKNFGTSPFDRNSFWLRPFYDDDVCWTGTKGEPFTDINGNQFWDPDESFTDVNNDGKWTGWDKYTQRQYWEFDGWNAISQKMLADDDPNNDVTAAGAQRIFMYETRKQPPLKEPDYNIDAGFGGPVPIIGKKLGDLRFFTSYRRNREMLLVPMSRDDYVDYDWSMKVQSDLSPSMKLMLSGFTGKQFTMQTNWPPITYLRTPEQIAGSFADRLAPMFSNANFSLADIGYSNISAKMTHFLNSNTFYEVSLEHLRRNYNTRPGARRDVTTLYQIVPGYYMDETPFGYEYHNIEGIVPQALYGGQSCKYRDNTDVSSTSFKMDISSQVNYNNLAKAGIEIVTNDLNFDYGVIVNYTDDRYSERVQLRAKPVRGALYLQDKLEARGFIMNLGLRLDYSNSNTDWWDVDAYNNLFFTNKFNDNLEFIMKKATSQWQWSPRLGISHPITQNSKLFFNYGHFKQMPSYETLFRIQRSSDRTMLQFGDPNLILAKTISYELGYDHSLFNALLLQLSAFYHDISDQQDVTTYTSVGGIVYDRTTSNSYEDIRGFELSLKKGLGQWWTFFANYTYQISTSGHFGREQIYQDPSKQKQYDEATINRYQDRPIPRPYARANLTLYTPDDFGPKLYTVSPLGGYSLNFLFNWQAGAWVTWNPKEISSIANNVQQTDYFNTLLRFGKRFTFDKFRIYAFIDIENIFNYRRMSLVNFGGKAGDSNYYYESLHLPASKAYDNIPGDDRIGSYRKDGVKYQPMFGRGKIDYTQDVGETGVIYYDKATKKYVEYVDSAWRDVDKKRLNKILDDKAYIDMPDQDSLTFLNPRQIFFGLQLSFDLK